MAYSIHRKQLFILKNLTKKDQAGKQARWCFIY